MYKYFIPFKNTKIILILQIINELLNLQNLKATMKNVVFNTYIILIVDHAIKTFVINNIKIIS